MDKYPSNSFEYLIESIVQTEISQLLNKLNDKTVKDQRNYLTIKEVSSMTEIGTYTLRQLTYARAMPHLRVKSRLLFDEKDIAQTIKVFKDNGWTDPENNWDVKTVQSDIEEFQSKKEDPILIDEVIRKIIREELDDFSKEILSQTKKDKERYYGRTVLTIKEAANYFRTSPATIYSLIKEDGMPHLKLHSRFLVVLEEAEAFLWRETAKSYAVEGNIYWQRILLRLDLEEKERNLAYEKALKRLEESTNY
ncbi:helix-turn-helix domain-containing protein [Virgibacillus sp. AGTR]|uniref:helix-turn-helix domain-containing protein n=1 Tax=Virgibacillus sp. AGTR TaxID=2812055 RepID=UPI001D15F14B|nr:helix-turn-helix domain-containing protein [Virgibacillus sp. AGTR]MCC2251887.1 helix-turn-helix domain-containing protein [Virgibacillus sp. AGTR]